MNKPIIYTGLINISEDYAPFLGMLIEILEKELKPNKVRIRMLPYRRSSHIVNLEVMITDKNHNPEMYKNFINKYYQITNDEIEKYKKESKE